ncbi:hypothetical protein [Streptomyces yangpuensis]|uniref:hypothetical protein n=1 Tax=Streptomyces yangpuensis TaxID=1648182 RepID=UPI003717DF15
MLLDIIEPKLTARSDRELFEAVRAFTGTPDKLLLHPGPAPGSAGRLSAMNDRVTGCCARDSGRAQDLLGGEGCPGRCTRRRRPC